MRRRSFAAMARDTTNAASGSAAGNTSANGAWRVRSAMAEIVHTLGPESKASPACINPSLSLCVMGEHACPTSPLTSRGLEVRLLPRCLGAGVGSVRADQATAHASDRVRAGLQLGGHLHRDPDGSSHQHLLGWQPQSPVLGWAQHPPLSSAVLSGGHAICAWYSSARVLPWRLLGQNSCWIGTVRSTPKWKWAPSRYFFGFRVGTVSVTVDLGRRVAWGGTNRPVPASRTTFFVMSHLLLCSEADPLVAPTSPCRWAVDNYTTETTDLSIAQHGFFGILG